jgi:hypothetical protein
MDELRADRPFLERLSTGELIKLADTYGVDIPPDLGRLIIIEELMDLASENEVKDEKAQVLREKSLSDSAPLPKQYNITFIEVLIRDPFWAFAFWEINSNDKEWYERSAGFDGYVLKVIPADGDAAAVADGTFTVSVGNSDTAWYLGFSPAGGGSFKVELCVLYGETTEVLAVSRPFRMPLLLNPLEYSKPSVCGEQGNALIFLSGIEDFPILRNTDRSPRLKRRN